MPQKILPWNRTCEEMFCGSIFVYQLKNFTPTMSRPRRESTTPVTRFRVLAGALLANRAATLAPRKVNRMQKKSAPRSGREPSMKKWEASSYRLRRQ